MTKKIDADVLALEQARKALLKSTSKKMLEANIKYLIDYFLAHPPEKKQKRWL